MRLYISSFLIAAFIPPTLHAKSIAMNCAECHAHETMLCLNSPKALHHTYANRYLSDAKDSKPFDGRTYAQGLQKYEFYKSEGSFIISVEDKNTASKKIYTAVMALGVEPLVQYIVERERGAFQVFPIAYDPKSDELFNVFGDEKRLEGEWGHWLAKGMNWNSNCAYCHMTGFYKNYDAKGDSYESKFAMQGISCLQCHQALPKDCKQPNLPILSKRPTKEMRMQSCASCHSRREQLDADKFKVGDDYFNSFRPALPTISGAYYADGKVKEEDFVFSSFMMCRQYIAGLTCTDCHDPHSLKTPRPAANNELCLMCHAPAAKNFKGAPTIVPNEHSFHGDNSGNLCVNCHMPKTTYMGRDERFDHGFTSPDPVLTREIGIPNACSQCHQKIDSDKPERDLDWLIESFEKNYGTPRFLRKRARSIAVYKAHSGEASPALKSELMRLLELEENYAWQATLISLLSPWIADNSVKEKILKMAESTSPLVRSAAIMAISPLPDSLEILGKSLSDPSKLVRIDSAFALGGNLDTKSIQYSELAEYLDFNSDRPLGLLKRADFALREGRFREAADLAKSALRLESGNPALEREIAIMVFKAGFSEEAANFLKDSRMRYPESAEIAYALALMYGELGDMENTVKELESTIKLDPKFSRAWYNLSVALFRMGKTDEAIKAIDKAIETDPLNANQYLNVRAYFTGDKK